MSSPFEDVNGIVAIFMLIPTLSTLLFFIAYGISRQQPITFYNQSNKKEVNKKKRIKL